MNQDPTEIRLQIEKTRERLGETADAIRYKLDVPARVRERLSDGATSIASDPLRMVAGASIAGFLAGLILPMMPFERRWLSPFRRNLLGAMGWLNPLEAVRRVWSAR
jgi:hypothetical protein